jgi:transposase-like protein
VTAPRVACPRCKTITLEVLEASPEITFYRCPHCERHYARKPGIGLVDRWLSPVSLALYGVIYEPDAILHAPRIARELASARDRASIEALAREIQLELDEPTQRVAEILDMAALKTEEHLREFLRLVVEHLRQAAVRRAPR